MSQVKKLQPGGTTPNGKFRLNGREITGQFALDSLQAESNKIPIDERESFDAAMRAISDGNTVEYFNNNTIKITDKNGNDISRNYIKSKGNESDSTFLRNWDATFNTASHRLKKGLERMAYVNMNTPEEKPKEAPSKTTLRRGYKWWDYDKDSEGNLVYRENGPGNQDRMAVLKGARTYFDDKDINTLKDRFSTEGWSSREIDSFRNMYNSLDDAAKNDFWTNLESHIKTNQLTSAEEEVLNLFGFNRNGSMSRESVNEDSSAPTIHKDWKGDVNLAKKYGIGLDFKDGNWYITGDNDFAKQNWYTGDMDWLAGTEFEDGFIINGRLYSANDVTNKYNLSPEVQQILTPWFSTDRSKSNWRDFYDALNASNIRFIGDRAGKDSSYYGIFNETFNPSTDYDPTWYNYFNKLGNRSYDIADLSGAYGNLGNRKVLSYIDPTQVNTAGMYIPKFVVYDSSNTENPYLSYNNENDMISALGLTAPTGRTYSGSITKNPWETIKNNDYAVFKEFGKPEQENTVLIDRNGKYYLGRKDPSGNLIKPTEITNKDFVKNLIADATKYNNISYKELERLIKAQINADDMRAQMPALKKEGGKIEKLGFGRALQSTTTTAKSKDISEANTDITKSHALDGSDGGLTKAEQLQITAAIGDLAGVGLSFVPGAGNIAGVATGVGASTAKFVGDIKQDGFQGKDLGGYAVNLVLDAASILPIVGTGAKAAKAAKVIKSVGKPLIKALSLYGASAPVITAVTKIANGEKYTSADLVQAIQGIGSGIISGKMLKDSIGNAKLAKKVATKAADTVNARLNATKSAEAGGFKMERTPDQLQAFVTSNPTKSKAIETVQAFAKHEGKEITTSDAEKILTDLGINFNKGKANFSLKTWKKGFHTRGEATTSFDRLEPAEASSTFKYLVNPVARSKVLGSEAVFGFGKNPGQMNLIKKSEISSALRRLQSGRASLTDQALLRMTAENPQAFGNLFGTKDNYNPSTSRKGFYFGGNRYYRRPAETRRTRKTSPPVTPLVTPSITGKLGEAEWNNYLDSVMPIIPIGQMQSPYMVDVPLRTARTYSNGVPALEYLSFKKGGKIQKAQGGSRTSRWMGGLDWKPLFVPNIENTPIPLRPEVENSANPSHGLSETIQMPKNNSIKEDKKPVTKKIVRGTELLPSVQPIKTPRLVTTSFQGVTAPIGKPVYQRPVIPISPNDPRSGGPTGKATQVNTSNLTDLIRAGITARGIYRDKEIQQDALGRLKNRQFITPHLDRIRYDFSDIDQGYNTQYNKLLGNKFVTSNARDALAFNLAKSQQLSDVTSQKNTLISQRINQINDQNRQIDATNATNAANTANQKSAYLTQLDYQDRMADSLALNKLYSEVINPIGYQFSQQGRDAANQIYDLEYNQAYTKAAEKRANTINALPDVVALKNEYKADTNRGNISFENWLQLDASRVKRYSDAIDQSGVNQTYNQDLMNAQKLRSKQYGPSILFNKKGGTIKKGRTPIEQMAINADSHAKKSSAELSKSLQRMLQQLLK